MKNEQVKAAGNLHKYGFQQADTVFSVGGISPTILAHLQGQMGHQVNILEEDDVQIPSTACKEGE